MRLSLACLLFALAALAAACGGGGSGGTLPNTTAPGGPASPSHATRGMAVVLNIPPANKQSKARKPFFVSPNTQSIVFAVIPFGSGTPVPAQAQVFPVTTPSPCATNPSTGGESCTFVVQAPFGNDQFYVATFGVPNPSVSSSPLAAFVSGAIVVASPSPGPTNTPLAFTMNGIVNSVVVTVPSPDPSNTPNTQVLPAAVASSPLPLGITPYDASGAPIMTDGFAGAITLNVTPANAGVTLAINATCPGSSGSGATVNVGCAADLAHVTFAYDGTTTPDPSDHITDKYTIAASQTASPAPSPANVVLASNLKTWQVATLPTSDSWYQEFLSRQSNGQFLYAATEYNGSAYVTIAGTFDPSNGTLSAPVTLNGNIDIIYEDGIAIASNGNVWINNNGPLDCYSSVASMLAGSPPVETGLYPWAPPSDSSNPLFPSGIAADAAGNIWYVAYDSNAPNPSFAGYFNSAAECVASPPTLTAQFTLTGDLADSYPDMVTSGNGFATLSSSARPPTAYNMTTSSVSGNVSPSATMNLANGVAAGFAIDAAGTLYALAADYSTVGDVEMLAPGGGSFTTLLSLPPVPKGSFPYPDPYWLEAFSPNGAGAADRLMYVEGDFGALGLIESVPASPMPLLVGLPNAYDIEQPAYSTNGAEYVIYVDTSNNLQLARVLPTKTWSVPNLQISAFSCSATALLPVLERGDSGPFTVNITPTSAGVTSTPLPGIDHDFVLTIPTTSTAFTAQVTDSHGRSESYTATSIPRPASFCALARRPSHRRR